MATTVPLAPFMSPKGTVSASQILFVVKMTFAPTFRCVAVRKFRNYVALCARPRSLGRGSAARSVLFLRQFVCQ